MSDAIIVVNAGSSSVKFGIYEIDTPLKALCVGRSRAGLTAALTATDGAGHALSGNPLAEAASTLTHEQAQERLLDWIPGS